MKFRKLIAIAAFAAVSFAVGCGDTNTSEPQADAGVSDTTESHDEADGESTDDAEAQEEDTEATQEDVESGGDVEATQDIESGGDTEETEQDIAEDPCGNGTIDPGETCDDDCPTSCNDGNACTEDTLSGDANICTSQCAHTPITACNAYEGDYSGTYFISATERVGSTVIHAMKCTGTFDITVDLSREDHLKGTAECTYSDNVGGFEETQTATISGGISPDGSFSARLSHHFGTENDTGRFTVDGTLSGGSLSVDDTGGFSPNPMTAFPWEVVIQLGDI